MTREKKNMLDKPLLHHITPLTVTVTKQFARASELTDHKHNQYQRPCLTALGLSLWFLING